jgi:DNA-binding response OmpR family regulator
MKLGRENCFLWVDLRHTASPHPCADIGVSLAVHVVVEASNLPEAITLHRPLFLCFDFDQPGKQGLLTLQETKRTHAHLPILMLTEQHSEELAVWALRNRVWDYLVKPLAQQELQHSLRALMRVSKECRGALRIAHRAKLQRYGKYPATKNPCCHHLHRSALRAQYQS